MDAFDHSEYRNMVNALAKPGQAILNSLTPEKCHYIHMAVGMSGEYGELIEPLRMALSLQPYDSENLKEELGDYEFYFQGYAEPLDYEYSSSDIAIYPHIDVVSQLGIATADLLDLTKKFVIYNKMPDYEGIKKQLNLIRLILINIYSLINFKHEEVLEANMNKLLKGKNARYSSGSYSDQQAQQRADKTEISED